MSAQDARDAARRALTARDDRTFRIQLAHAFDLFAEELKRLQNEIDELKRQGTDQG